MAEADIFSRTEKAIDAARHIGKSTDVFGNPRLPCDDPKQWLGEESCRKCARPCVEHEGIQFTDGC